MRIDTVKTAVYQFNELSEQAKQKAIDWWIGVDDHYPWHDENTSSLHGFCDEFNLSRLSYEYSTHRPSFANAEIDDVTIAELSGIRLFKYLTNNYDLKTLLSGNCPFTGYYLDESLVDPIRKFMKKPDSRSFQDLIDDCLTQWATDVVKDIEHYYSEESAIESIIANEYEFTENGRIY
jgi:hypothetical protein